MQCTHPTKFPNSNAPVACKQCMPCRINRKTEWKTKLLLEQKYYGDNVAFITLTYAPEYLPDAEYFQGGSLQKEDIQKFIKRFRRNYQYQYDHQDPIRYFAVGEYGDNTKRAHYHIIMFGVDPHRARKITEQSWQMGRTQTDRVKSGGMEYVCGYTTKKLTSEYSFPDGRNPEFSLKSTKPSLGHVQIPKIADALNKANLLPSGNTWETWLIEQQELVSVQNVFQGILGSNHHLRLDEVFMKKLLAYMRPLRSTLINQLDAQHAIYPKAYKIRQNRLYDDTINRNRAKIERGETDETTKKAEKLQRSQENKRKI